MSKNTAPPPGTEAVKPVLKPLNGSNDQLALEICRYQNHISQIHELDSACRQTASEVNGLNMQVHEKRQNISSMMRTIAHITAEARDQVGRLLALGMTQDEISNLIPVPQIALQLNIADVVPPRLRQVPEEPATPPPPEKQAPVPSAEA